MQMILRKSNLADERDIARIIMACHWKTPVADRELLALRWIRFYLVAEPENSYVIEHPDLREAVGYIFCASDTMAFEDEFEKVYLPKIRDRFEELNKQAFEHLEDNRKLLHFRRNRDIGFDATPEYPAHLHINILPEYQRSGYGAMLLSAYEDNLRSRGVIGYHLITGANNAKGISFYKKHSLELLHTVYHDGKPATSIWGKRL